MENAELEVALEELETRLERLRALYEQYFMGIERIEPAIPRKDIDRRIYVLRREKIRNTAKRFKLQTIISRYNTFQQYWQRICREIENGTYKRHVIRAERIAPGQILTIAARKRLGRAALEAMEPSAEGGETGAPSAPPGAAPSAPPSAAPSAPPSAVPGAPRSSPRSAPAPSAQRVAPPPKPIPPPKPGRPAVAPPAAAASAGTPAAITSAPAPAASAPASATPPRRPPTVRPAFESLDLDMDFLGDWDPAAAINKKRAAEGPARPFGKPLSRPMSTPPTPAVSGAPRQAAPKPAPSAPVTPRIPSAPPPKPVTIPPRPAAAPPPPISKPLAAEPAPPPPAARPLGPIIPGTTPPKPAAAKPAAAKPAAAKPAAASASAAASSPAIDERVRELHARLVEAKRQTQDAVAVSVEGLAKSMKATEAKLREQHKNRKIDFDVVIKDGKAVLKPIVR
ncbi:MAG TPA: MXAN_5187 C-terminal domain-containing protein [Polyangiaceae bacterium]|nr:MXAN_5187 C-terminal domain-containing protein [Polyangiaceae bacterium]